MPSIVMGMGAFNSLASPSPPCFQIQSLIALMNSSPIVNGELVTVKPSLDHVLWP